MAKFSLEIQLGNDAMQSRADIAAAVRLIFSDFSRRDEVIAEDEDERGRIYDANGNRVGYWEITEND